ncbi:MAG: hypothetical protein R3300_02850 [Candidatus Promineifilaceae bacterium]|nr:hypothetical protein [Candidatus Promineifilaceae bacterium]
MRFLNWKWFLLVAVLLLATACSGGDETGISAPEGPALVMVYTDN